MNFSLLLLTDGNQTAGEPVFFDTLEEARDAMYLWCRGQGERMLPCYAEIRNLSTGARVTNMANLAWMRQDALTRRPVDNPAQSDGSEG